MLLFPCKESHSQPSSSGSCFAQIYIIQISFIENLFGLINVRSSYVYITKYIVPTIQCAENIYIYLKNFTLSTLHVCIKTGNSYKLIVFKYNKYLNMSLSAVHMHEYISYTMKVQWIEIGSIQTICILAKCELFIFELKIQQTCCLRFFIYALIWLD